MEKEPPTPQELHWMRKYWHVSTVGPFNCPEIGVYYVVRTPGLSDPLIFTQDEYDSL